MKNELRQGTLPVTQMREEITLPNVGAHILSSDGTVIPLRDLTRNEVENVADQVRDMIIKYYIG